VLIEYGEEIRRALEKSVRPPGLGCGFVAEIPPEGDERGKAGGPRRLDVGGRVPDVESVETILSARSKRVEERGGIGFAAGESVARDDDRGGGQLRTDKAGEDRSGEGSGLVGHDAPTMGARTKGEEKFGNPLHPGGVPEFRLGVEGKETVAEGFVRLRIVRKRAQGGGEEGTASERNDTPGGLGRRRRPLAFRAERGEGSVEVGCAVDERSVEIEKDDHRARSAPPGRRRRMR
jgi:hypothetical protein